MRRVILAVAGTVTALVLLLSFKTHSTAAAQAAQPTVVRAPTTAASTSTSTSPAPTADAGGTSTKPVTVATTSASPTSTTVTGDAVDTRYGPVQVQITVVSGKVTAAQAVEYPQNDPRDQQINAYAVPVLAQETVAAGDAQIDMVSGATYTSDGYVQSLQSALDQAGLT